MGGNHRHSFFCIFAILYHLIMNKVQRTWPEVARDLNQQLALNNLDYKTLASASGASYYAVRRLKLGGVHNQSINAKKLCTYFNIKIDIEVKVQTDHFSKLVSELEAVWDGSEPHAKLLSKLIRSTKSFRVEGRKESTNPNANN